MTSHWFKTIFASTGDKTTVPNTDPSGYVAYDVGYPFDYQRVLGTDPLAKPIERVKLNQILNDVTGVLNQYQINGAPEYIDATANGGTAYAYAIGARVIFTDGKYYENTVAGNTAAPNVSGWIELGSVSTVTHNIASDADYTLSASENKHLRIIITDTGVLLTTARNIIVDNSQKRFLVFNSTLQALTFKTAAGTGISVAAGKTADLVCDGTNVLEATPSQFTSKQVQYIDATVATNALTATINPTTLDFRSATLGSGVVTQITNAAAVSVTVPSGATLGTTSGVAARLYILAINNAGTMEAAIINVSHGDILSESSLISTTAISGTSNSYGVAYSTVARTNVAFRIVGFIDITEATAGTWATAPSEIQGVGGLVLAKDNRLIAEAITTASVTSIDITGLDINTHKNYIVEIEFINATASAGELYMFVNGDTTTTNYYTQSTGSSSTTLLAARNNFPRATSFLASSNALGIGEVAIINGYPMAHFRTNYGAATSSVEQPNAIQKTATVTNITQLTFVSSVASAIAAGSKIRIYRGDK